MQLDFSSQAHYILALAPEILLSIWGMVVLIAGVTGNSDDGEGRSPTALGWLSLVGLVLAALANGWLYGLSEVGSDGMIALDGFRLFANWIFLLGAALSILISHAYVTRQRFQAGEFYALMLFATVGMMFMGGTRDLMVVFLGLELMSVGIYALAGFNRRDRRSAEAGLKYFLMGAFATGFLLFGIALVYGGTGSTNIARVADAIGTGRYLPSLVLPGVGLLAVGFCFKVAAVPFHMWTPDVYEGAPAPVTAFMAAAVKAAAFVAFLRLFYVGFESVYASWYTILWWVAAITMVVANLIALVQANVKRMLAYSSIAHAGYLLVAIVASNEVAAGGLLFYLLVYTLMNIGAFAIVIAVANQGEDRLQIEDYAGFGWKQPLMGVMLTVFLLSLAGFPGTGGFMGKIFLLQGAAEANLWVLSIILVLTTVASYWYYLRVAWYMWMRDATSEESSAPFYAPLAMRAALFASVALILLTGVFPGVALDFALASVEGLRAVAGTAASLP